MDERVLVTGATGFIGSHLVDSLLVNGYEVDVLVREKSDLRWLPGKRINLMYGDLTGKDAIPSLNGINHIFHLGGATRAVHTRDFYGINRDGTERLLNAASNIRGLKRFVYMSSQAAAGPSPEGRPQTEEDLPHPVSPYGESKLQAEHAVLACRDRFHVTILRPCAVYGQRDTYTLELFKSISMGFLPSIGGGPMYLSFCYVHDLVRALILSVRKDHSSGEIFFIADGGRYSMSFFAGLVAAELGVRLHEIHIPVWAARIYATLSDVWGMVTKKPAAFSRNKCAEGIQRNWVCATGKAQKILEFRPDYDLKTGLEATLQWYKENGWL
jgi:nucleoside-diphosphate-sugar epimerase